MKKRILIWHDQDGKIIAVGKPTSEMANRIEPRAAKPGHSVFSTDVEEDVIPKIIKNHVVDVANSRLKLKE